MTLTVNITLSNNVFGQFDTLHDQTLFETTRRTSGFDENPHITVGDAPRVMTIGGRTKDTLTLYVANSGELGMSGSSNPGNDSVSIIQVANNTKIEDIPVGGYPRAIAGFITAYVANFESNTVSVIDTLENGTRRVQEIPVGESPIDIAVVSDDEVYVANFESNTVSVIDTLENGTRRVQEIPVGESPIDIAVDLNNYPVYVVNGGSDNVSVSVIDTLENGTRGVVQEIPVGYANSFPISIGVSQDAVYVANAGYVSGIPSTVSVIDTLENGTRGVVQEIPVGEVSIKDMAVNQISDTVYLAREDSNTVSVIDTLENGTRGVVQEIPVGESPIDIAVDMIFDRLYVANFESNTVSVIDTLENGTRGVVQEIPVGEGPRDIAVDPMFTDTVYVANHESNSVSVIDARSNRVVAGVTFNVNPFNSGYIACEDLTTPSGEDLTPPSPTGQYTYVYSGTQCTATPNQGFEFSSWEENLGDNSTQPISVSRPTSSLDSFLEFLHLKSTVKPEGTLNVTKFGTFTANFREAPPPLPQEFWAQLYAVIATVVTALFIPSIVGWIRSKRDLKKLNYYHKQIASLYDDGRLDENDMETLDRLRSRVTNAYSEGKVNEKHYETLKGEISTLYEEIFRKKIAALDGRNNYSVVRKPIQEQLAQIKNEIKYAFSKGKINEKHYDLLKEDISNLEGKENAPQKQAKTS